MEAIETRTTHDTTGILGHPSGLTTLFFTEMWERFSFYGMRTLLILYMTAPVAYGGLAFNIPKAASIYGTYTMSVYLLALPGGFIADRFLGARYAVLLGGIIIALGHFSMIFAPLPFFYTGLTLIAIGTGLLKPNISAMVGSLYRQNDPRRDSGFSIFFMGINIGGMLASVVCSYLAQSESFKDFLAALGFNPNSSWHWGFGAAAVGMGLGLIQYLTQQDRLAQIGLREEKIISIHVETNPLTQQDWKRMLAIFILFFFTIIFGTASEQVGSSLNLFADRLTRTQILSFSFPSGLFQSLTGFYVLLLAPIFSILWIRLGDRQPSTTAKFSLSLFFLGLAFLLMVPACLQAASGKVSPLWLLGFFFLLEVGSVMLNTVGLSTITKLAPAKLVGIMMGVWFLASAIASKTAGYFAGLFDESKPAMMAELFGFVSLLVLVSAGILALLMPLMRRLMGGVK
ncbi:MAG: peptide MFS transporter [Bacteroidota bacterium]